MVAEKGNLSTRRTIKPCNRQNHYALVGSDDDVMNIGP